MCQLPPPPLTIRPQMIEKKNKLTFPVVKAKINSIIHNHQGPFGVALSIIAWLPVAHQGNHMLLEELLHF